MKKSTISRRQFMKAMGAASAAGMLAACGSDTTTSSTATSTSTASTDSSASTATSDITLRYCYFNDDEPYVSCIQSLIADYTAQTGIKIEELQVAYDDSLTYLATQFTAKQGPDVYYGIDTRAESDYNSGYVCDLSPYYSEVNPYDGYSWRDSLADSVYERIVLADGAVAGYPSCTAMVRLFCNKEMFDAAGATVPETWVEFMDACEKLLASGVTPYAFPNATSADIDWFWFNNSLSNQLQPALIQAMDEDDSGFIVSSELVRAIDNGLTDFTSAGPQLAYELMMEFSQYWTSDYNSLDTATSKEMFAMQKAAMVTVHSTALTATQDLINGAFECTSMKIPYVSQDQYPDALGDSVVLGGQPDNLYMINKDLEGDPEKFAAALDFCWFMTSADACLRRLNECAAIPVSTTVDISEELAGYVLTEEPLRMQVYGWDDNCRDVLTRGGQMMLEGSISTMDLGEMMNEAYTDYAANCMAEYGWSADNNYGLDV